MNAEEFQARVVDALARIETKQDITNGRVTRMESQVQSLELSRAGEQARKHLVAAILGGLSGLCGAAFGGFFEYLFRR